MNEILKIDRELFLYLNNLGHTTFDQAFTLISGNIIWISFYIVLLYFILKTFSIKNTFYIIVFIALGITISDQLTNIFKFGIQRLRPCHDETLVPLMRIVGCGGTYGFYSAHASNSFFIANFLSIILKKNYKFLPAILFFWSTLVAYSRIYLGVHFPLDISYGAAVGFLLGGLMSNLTLKIVNRNLKLTS